MIEMEIKFALNKKDEERLIEGARFIGQRVHTDTYYDTKTFSLTSRDIWLRRRDGKFEMKIPLHKSARRTVDQYNELNEDEKIKNFLGIPGNNNLADDLKKHGYEPFCLCKTTPFSFADSRQNS